MNKKQDWIDVDTITFNIEQISNLMDLVDDEVEDLTELKMSYKQHPSETKIHTMTYETMQRLPYLDTLNNTAKDLLNRNNKSLKQYVNQLQECKK